MHHLKALCQRGVEQPCCWPSVWQPQFFHKNAFATKRGRHLMFCHRALRRQLKENGLTIVGGSRVVDMTRRDNEADGWDS